MTTPVYDYAVTELGIDPEELVHTITSGIPPAPVFDLPDAREPFTTANEKGTS